MESRYVAPIIGLVCTLAVLGITAIEEFAGPLILATMLGTGAMAFWDIRWAKHVGRYTIRLPDVSAYSTRYSFDAGEGVPIHLHTTAPAQARLYRFGSQREDLGSIFSSETMIQSGTFDLKSGFTWPKAFDVPTQDLKPGLYAVEIRQTGSGEKAFAVPFVIKSKAENPIGVILCTNSWDAYNDFGGVSKYTNSHFNFFAKKVLYWAEALATKGELYWATLPNARPNSLISNDMVGQTDPWQKFHSRLVRGEWCLIALLESAGYPYTIFTDGDLDSDPRILDCKGLFFGGHAEYWSEGMFFAFDRFILGGGKAAFGAGMPMAGLVTLNGTTKSYTPVELDHTVSASRVGGHFTHAGSMTAAPYRVINAASWVFEGTRLGKGDEFGAASAYQPVEDFAIRGDTVSSGASGVWMNEVGRESGSFEILARGLNQEGGANMLYRDTPAGGWTFNAGSEAFFPAARNDPRIHKIICNLATSMLGEPKEFANGSVSSKIQG